MADRLSREERSALMSRIKSRDTGPEIALRRALFGRGLRFRIHRRGLPGKPDIVFVSKRVAVFCHGCFWHGHEGCYRAPKTNMEFWSRKLAANMDRDRRNRMALEAMGWRVVQVWECHIRRDIDTVVNSIVSLLSLPFSPPSGCAL
jgi:DNA mismatch endonuclease (patch repair protein)